MAARHLVKGSSVAFATLGCRLNQAEEADAAALLVAAGLRLAGDGEVPDAIVIHSCAVTRRAERDTFRRIRSIRADSRYSDTLVAVTGCAVECNDHEALFEAGADFVVGRRDFGRLATILLGGDTDEQVGIERFPSRTPLFRTKRALLKVQDGCSMRCAYCIVPYTRGPAVSRPVAESVGACRALLEKGFKEIVLTGCNLAAYRDGATSLPGLVAAVADEAASFGSRIRIGSVEPGICDEELVRTVVSRPNICRFFHFPVQSADGAVLRAMGRPYSPDYLESLFARIRGEMPLASINADIIAGLPGEDETAFARTCEFVERSCFAHIHVFPFSPRQMTRAKAMADCPSRTVAMARAAALRGIGDRTALAYRRSLVGHEAQVLVEGVDSNGRARGWNDGRVPCLFAARGARVASIATFMPSSVDAHGNLTDKSQDNDENVS